MELVTRWWNGERRRATRRDIWLGRDGERWFVRARQGVAGDPEVRQEFVREYEARALVDQLITAAPGGWKDITRLIARPSNTGKPPG